MSLGKFIAGGLFVGLLLALFGRNDDAAIATSAGSDQPSRRTVLEDRCPSPFDGSVPTVINAVKETLRDPDSFRHVRTALVQQGAPDVRRFIMEYRSKNGFGGYNTERATGGYDPSRQCELFELNGTRIYHLDFNRRMLDAEKSRHRYYPKGFPQLAAEQLADLQAYRNCFQWEARNAFAVNFDSMSASEKADQICVQYSAKLTPYLSKSQIEEFAVQEFILLTDWIQQKT